MMVVPHHLSPAHYFDIERQSQIRHEYRRGLVYTMAGGTDNHDQIALNPRSLINLHLGDSDCRFRSGNVKLKEYALIFQDSQRVGCRRRTLNNTWETAVYGADDQVLLNSIDLKFKIAELYRGLDSQRKNCDRTFYIKMYFQPFQTEIND